MNPLQNVRCFNHAHREAVGRCIACSRCFCRECVVPHDDRLLCAVCLAAAAAGPARSSRHSRLRQLAQAARAALFMALAWYAFFLLLRGLCDVPADFHHWADHTAGREVRP